MRCMTWLWLYTTATAHALTAPHTHELIDTTWRRTTRHPTHHLPSNPCTVGALDNYDDDQNRNDRWHWQMHGASRNSAPVPKPRYYNNENYTTRRRTTRRVTTTDNNTTHEYDHGGDEGAGSAPNPKSCSHDRTTRPSNSSFDDRAVQYPTDDVPTFAEQCYFKSFSCVFFFIERLFPQKIGFALHLPKVPALCVAACETTEGPRCSAEARVRWPESPETKNRRVGSVQKSRKAGTSFCVQNKQKERCQSEKSMCHKMTSHLCTPQVSPRYPPDRSVDIPPIDCRYVEGKPRTGGPSPADAKAGPERHTGGHSPAGARAQLCLDRCFVGPHRNQADPLHPQVPSAPITGPRTVDSRPILGRDVPAIVTLVGPNWVRYPPPPPLYPTPS